MKKILVGAMVVGLFGVQQSAQAAANVSALPAELQEKLRGKEMVLAETQNPISDFVNDNMKKAEATKAWLSKLPGYVKDSGAGKISVEFMEETLSSVTDSLNQVNKVAGLANPVVSGLSQLNTTSEFIIDNYLYPEACRNKTKLGATKGCVMNKLGSRTEYALYENDCNNQKPPLGVFVADIEPGQFGTGKGFVPSILKNTHNVPVFIQKIDGQNVVVCIDRP